MATHFGAYLEMPAINEAHLGRRHRYVYGYKSQVGAAGRAGKAGPVRRRALVFGRFIGAAAEAGGSKRLVVERNGTLGMLSGSGSV